MSQYDIRGNSLNAGAQLGQSAINAYTDQMPKQIGLMEGCDNELGVVLKQLHELHAQAKNIGDRVFGTMPEAVRAVSKDSAGNVISQAARLETTVGYIRESLKELGAQLMRFERL